MSTIYVDNLQPNLGSGVLIPGHVVGFQTANHNSQQIISSTSFVSIGLSVSYAAKSATSKLLFSWAIPVELYDAGANSEVIGEMALYKDGTSIGNTYQTITTMQSVTRSGSSTNTQIVLTAGDTSSHTYAVYAKVSVDEYTVFRYNLIGHLNVLEIAQ
jgi:hypothetical protein